MSAEAPKKEVKETVLKTVQLDGQVVLKIVKHCTDAAPQLVTGQLLGLDVGQTLEVTDCFPFPVRAALSLPALPISAAQPLPADTRPAARSPSPAPMATTARQAPTTSWT
jgi:hypothetical protein